MQIEASAQAGAVGRFSKYGKALGTGLVAVDFASRIGNVQNTYKAEGNWERELFIESSSFAASVWAGGAIAKAGVGFFVLATPVGWVGLIVVAAATSLTANYLIKEKSGSVYDRVMEWLSPL